MKKQDNKSFFAIIIGSIIIAATIYFVYSNSSDATLTKKCKELSKQLSKKTPSLETMIFSRCINGQF